MVIVRSVKGTYTVRDLSNISHKSFGRRLLNLISRSDAGISSGKRRTASKGWGDLFRNSDACDGSKVERKRDEIQRQLQTETSSYWKLWVRQATLNMLEYA